MLEITHLDFDYQDRLFLKGIDLSLPPGGLLHLKGANGAGKTTLLRLIAGLFEPDAGAIRINGLRLCDDAIAYRQALCLVSHKTGLNPYLTVQEALFFDLANIFSKAEILEKMKQFHLQDLADTRTVSLSAGQQRRVALLRLSLTKAMLWLLDEPLVALDEESMQLLATLINRHRACGGAVVLTSHQTLPKALKTYQEYSL